MTSDPMTVFDRSLVRTHRDRAAATLDRHDFLFREAVDRLIERLTDVNRCFDLALDLGCHTGQVAQKLVGLGKVDKLVQCDLSPAMAAAASAPGTPAVAADEERLPFAEGVFDLIVSSLSLHWVNDLPGALIQIQRALKPDGLFVGAILGGDTLVELRRAVIEAELELRGGAAPRVSPFAGNRDIGALMQRAGFGLPVVDLDTIRVAYGSPLALLSDLRGMGETNAVVARNAAVPPRTLWPLVCAKYEALFGQSDGTVPATFDVITMTGWHPHDNQQQPLRPGSARHSLAAALGTVEHASGDKAAPR